MFLVHHSKKYNKGLEGDSDAVRGSGAIGNVVRTAGTLFPMSKEAAPLMGIPEEEVHLYVRYDDAKANYALVENQSRWFKKVSLTLPNGDAVGAFEPYTPTSLISQVPLETMQLIHDNIQAGFLSKCGNHIEYHTTNFRKENERWVGNLFTEHTSMDEDTAKLVVKQLKDKHPAFDVIQICLTERNALMRALGISTPRIDTRDTVGTSKLEKKTQQTMEKIAEDELIARPGQPRSWLLPS